MLDDIHKGLDCPKCPVDEFECDAQYHGSRCENLRAKAGENFDPETNADRILATEDTMQDPDFMKFVIGALIFCCASDANFSSNDPLEIADLPGIQEKLVWIVSLNKEFDDGWYGICHIDEKCAYCWGLPVSLPLKDYKKTWVVYFREPKGE